MKRVISLLSLCVVLSILFVVPHAYAQEVTITATLQPTIQPTQTRRDPLEGEKRNAYKEIDKRLKRIDELKKQIEKTKNLTPAGKARLLSDLEIVSGELNSIRQKIADATQKKTIRDLRKDIIKKYNVFNVMVPKVKTLIAVDSMEESLARLSSMSGKLKERVDAVPQESSGGAKLRTLYTKFEKDLKDADRRVANLASAAAGLKLDGYPKNKSVIDTLKKNVKSANKAIKRARNDAEKIIRELKKVPVATATPQPDATVAPTSSGPTPTAVPTPTEEPVPTEDPIPTEEPTPTVPISDYPTVTEEPPSPTPIP